MIEGDGRSGFLNTSEAGCNTPDVVVRIIIAQDVPFEHDVGVASVCIMCRDNENTKIYVHRQILLFVVLISFYCSTKYEKVL